MEKVNYQRRLDEVIAALGDKRPRLLLHSCCGPCSSYVIEYLSKHFDITVYYYNPNIHPESEYARRLETQKQLIAALGGAVLTESEYDPERFFAAVKGLESEPEGGARCTECFRLRLEATAKRAKEGSFDYFCTTLSVSPHKNSAVINALGGELGEKYGVNWLPGDFKKREGYKRSIELSKQFDLYRQDYCGCAFSMSDQAAERRRRV